MSNSAVITWDDKIGIYLHHYGDRLHIDGILAYCKASGFRMPHKDCYGLARVVQVISNLMGPDGLSVGIVPMNDIDTDFIENGVYKCFGWHVAICTSADNVSMPDDLDELLSVMEVINSSMPDDHSLQRMTMLETAKEYIDTPF